MTASILPRREQYLGVVAPVPRTKDDLDPVSIFHIATGYDMIRYFTRTVLQFQVRLLSLLCCRSLVKESVKSFYIHGCRTPLTAAAAFSSSRRCAGRRTTKGRSTPATSTGRRRPGTCSRESLAGCVPMFTHAYVCMHHTTENISYSSNDHPMTRFLH